MEIACFVHHSCCLTIHHFHQCAAHCQDSHQMCWRQIHLQCATTSAPFNLESLAHVLYNYHFSSDPKSSII
jgi:hypothetical protein